MKLQQINSEQIEDEHAESQLARATRVTSLTVAAVIASLLLLATATQRGG